MWSSPLKRTAPDGSEYSLLLLDSEGIDAYDQTVSSFLYDLILVLFLARLDLCFKFPFQLPSSLPIFPTFTPFLLLTRLTVDCIHIWQGTYSTQIFSLAVLLSSMFVYNQVSAMPIISLSDVPFYI